MSYEMNGAGGGAAGGSGAEWHQAKIREYFDQCFNDLYFPFLILSSDLVDALSAFVNDDEHKGAEAEQSKQFVNEMQIQTVVDTVYDIQLLCGLMQGDGFDEGEPLLEDFINTLEENEEAVIKTLQVEKVIKDFKAYSTDFKAIHPQVKSIRDSVLEAVAGCGVVTRTTWTDPDPKSSESQLDDFVSTEGETGTVQVFYKTFTDFLEEHKDDITGSTFKNMLDGITSNLQQIINGLGDGSFDITRYNETKDNIKWTNVRELLDGEALKKYLDYLDSYLMYLQGLIPRCQVYKYDPVNMSNGNYINDRVDLTVGGKHPIEMRRFYNAQAVSSRILGRGWTTRFDVRLQKGEDDTIKAVYADGHEGIYRKETVRGEEIYFEIHGEEGTLRAISSGYVIVADDGSYEEYDTDGYLVAKGDIRSNKDYSDVEFSTVFENCREEHTRITYETVTDAEGKEIALPVKAETKEGTTLLLSYNQEGTLAKITDHAGREVSYSYETRNTDDGRESFLTSVTYPNGSSRCYKYNAEGIICAVTSPEGIVALTNEYDNKKRVIRQTFPDGGEMSYSYDDEAHITTATEQNGCVVEYVSDERGRLVGTRYKGVMPGSTSQDVDDTEHIIEERYTYNERNQKTSFTDRNGHVTRYTYDNRGHLTGIIGPEGLHESYTYNADGKLTSKKDSEGNQYKYTYDTEGNLYCVTDPEGNRTRYDYADGKVICIRDAKDQKTTLTYDENGNVKTITDKAGITTTYECDSMGRVIATIDASGNRTEYTFDEEDNITSVTDALGNETRYDYNSAGLLTQLTNPDGTTKTWAYNTIGRPSLYIDEEGRKTRVFYNTSWKEYEIILPNNGRIRYDYDKLGNLIRITDPEGRKTGYSYDGQGNVLAVKKADDNLTVTTNSYRYDGLDRIVEETDGEGNKTVYTYDKNGNLVSKTDANGGKTCNEYDSLGRLIRTTDPLGRVIMYGYDANGNLETSVDATGVVTRNHYENDRVVKVTQCASGTDDEILVQSFEYDDCGRVRKQTERDGFTLENTYDAAGRLVQVTGSNGRVIKYAYDSCGRIVELDDCGAKTVYSYTGTGKLKSVIDALGNRTEYSYNELDLLAKTERFGDVQKDEKNRVILYSHDLSGKLISQTDALGNSDTYIYDAAGNIVALTDRDGNETVYTRDNNGNITGIKYADGSTVRNRYNALGILEEVEDKLGLTKIESDVLGRTVAVINPDGEKISYEYGPRDERTGIIYPDGTKAEYEYDTLGRLIKLTSSKNTKDKEIITYSYDCFGRLSKRSFPNGTEAVYDYYQGGLLKSLTSSDRDGILDNYEYCYNEKGNRTKITRNRRNLENVSGTYAYSYDDLGRLTGATRNGAEISAYSYDAFGNRTSLTEDGHKTTYSYDVLDRLMSRTDDAQKTISYSYDKRGNLIAERADSEAVRTYAYNFAGMLSETILDPGKETERSIHYTYNFQDQRVGKRTNEEEIRYLTDITRDHNNLLAQTVNGKTMTFTYDDNVVSLEQDGSRSYYQQDELGSTMYMTGTDGMAYNPYAYDPFGNLLDPQSGKTRSGRRDYTKDGNLIQPFAFTGYREEENGHYFAQARSYDPASGRFTGEDKVSGLVVRPESFNRYVYCNNDPTIYVDFNGLWPSLSDIGKGIKDAAVGMVNQIKEDPTKFVASVATGIVVGVATAAVAAAVVATAPAGLAAVAVGVVAYGVAGAVTGAVSSAVGQRCSKNYDPEKGIDKKEVLTAAIGGFAGGAIFGGVAGALSNSVAPAAGTFAKGVGSLLKSTGGKIVTAFASGFASGTAADATGQYLNSTKTGTARFGDINWGHAIGSGIFAGGLATAGYGASRTRPGRYVTNLLKEGIYDPVYNGTTSGLRALSAGISKLVEICFGESGGPTPKPLALENSPLPRETVEDVLSHDKGDRPDPKSYMSQEMIDNHMEKFKDGGSYVLTKEQYEMFVEGKSELGCPDNSQYITTTENIDRIIAESGGDIGVFEDKLGFDRGHFENGGGLVRIDVKDPMSLNPRMPSGNEMGANEHYIPGGYTDGPGGGSPEIVIDQFPNDDAYRTITFGIGGSSK